VTVKMPMERAKTWTWWILFVLLCVDSVLYKTVQKSVAVVITYCVSLPHSSLAQHPKKCKCQIVEIKIKTFHYFCAWSERERERESQKELSSKLLLHIKVCIKYMYLWGVRECFEADAFYELYSLCGLKFYMIFACLCFITILFFRKAASFDFK
jgi:hypothetical protein